MTILVLEKEIKVTFIYVSMCFVYAWLDLVSSNYKITYVNFVRWLIEASLLPLTLIATLLHNFSWTENFFVVYQLCYLPSLIIKFPVLVLMRYAEYQPQFSINTIVASIFDVFCNRLFESNIP